jgi:tripartite-type tricarboxylate transporter receptor subunit TctC
MLKRVFLTCAAACAGLIAFGAGAQAPADFPSRSVTIVVPYPPGGSVDFTARLLAQALSQQWKHPVVVENRSGAAAVIGSQSVARSKPDGHTILLATAGMSIQPSVYKDLPYDVFKDFVPVTHIVNSTSLLSVHPSVPGVTLAEVITYLKANRNTPYGSQGLGSHAHLLMEILRAQAGLEMLHVPYRGSAPATQALLGGETKLHFDIMASMLPHVAAGKAKAIAVTSAQRQKQLPNVQTMQEAGFPDVVGSWSGFFVPAGTPAAVVNEIQRATKAVLAEPAVSARLVEAGFGIVGGTPEEFRTFFQQDVARFQKAAAAAKIDKTTPN